VIPFRKEGTLAALQRQAGSGATVRYAAGLDLDGAAVPPSVLTPAGSAGGHGLLRTAADGTTQVDSVLDFTGDPAATNTQWTWTGVLTAPTTGAYDLKLQSTGGGGSLSLDGDRVLATGGFFGNASLIPSADGLSNATVTLSLVAGQAHQITVTFGGGGRGGGPFAGSRDQPRRIRLAWVTPERRQAFVDEAVHAAQSARAAVIFAYDEGTEGRDRSSLALGQTQDDLIEAVTAANSRTTVVLNTGDPVLMPWVARSGAVLQMWYPGQEGADATASLLLGAANPGGKLPVTFPREETQTPIAASKTRYPGIDGEVAYDEGTLVGYRWYDVKGVEPLFPFGHGLSYTSFAYSDLAVSSDANGVVVAFRVRNTGTVAGTEVPQVYLGPPSDPPVPLEPQKLVGFERITLATGGEREVTVPIDRRALSYWSVDRHDWSVATGRRPVYVGSSSRDIRLRGEVTVTPGGQ
jgi:beta-glucosidase